MQTFTIKITGMTCAGCASSIQKALQTIDGVESISISLEDHLAVVGCQEQTNVETLLNAIESAGFDAVVD